MIRWDAILLLGYLTACQAEQPPAASPGTDVTSAAPSSSVVWLSPESGAGAAWMRAPARAVAVPEASSSVSVPMTARVLRVRVRPGQRVVRGEPMLDVLLPGLLEAAGRVAATDLRIQAYETRKRRLAPLVEQGLATAAELSELQASLALARAERQAARATLRIAGVRDAEVARLLSGDGSLSLRAPMDGMVVEVSARPGQIREPASGALVELVGEGLVQIEAQFAFVPGPDLEYEWDSDGVTLPITLESVSPRATPASAMHAAWFAVAAEAASPAPNSMGTVRAKLPADSYVLPLAALIEAPAGTSVVVLSDARPVLQTVRKILSANGEVVVQGLGSEMRVAADGQRAREQMQEHP